MHPYDEVGANEQIDSLRKIRAERDNAAVGRCLRALRDDAVAGRNVMPAIVQAVKAYATVGEISDTLVGVYGRFAEPTRFG
jgi:methylmalonyl-CoA mutase N-terminal domain/subunit